MSTEPTLNRAWFDTNRVKRGEWVEKTLADIPGPEETGGKIHPLQLALDVQTALGDDDWLVIDGGNTHFWSEIAINIAGWQGQKLAIPTRSTSCWIAIGTRCDGWSVCDWTSRSLAA